MKKLVCLLLALVLCTALTIPAMAKIGGNYADGVYSQGFYFDGETVPSGQHDGVNIESNSSVKIDGTVRISSTCILRIRENGTLTITETGSLSGTDVFFSCNYGTPYTNSKIILKNGAWIRLELHSNVEADAFETLLQESDISYTRNGNFITAGKVPPCEHNNLKTVCADCGEVISTYSAAGSTLSEGNMTIIIGVAALVIGFLAAMFIFKKKKPAVAGGTDNTDEE